MIIVKKPFIYLKDMFEWSYQKWHDIVRYNDPSRIMIFERREDMSCSIFQDKDTKKTTNDAEYKIITLLDFFGNCKFIEKECIQCIYSKTSWALPFIKLGLKLVRNAEIGIPTKEYFPLIIRNDKYNFYIAPKIREVIEENLYLVKEE